MVILLTIFSNLNLRSIAIENSGNTGDIFSRLPSTLPNLEKLVVTNWRSLSNQGIIEILNRSRSNLRELDLSDSNITGVGVEEGVNSLPNLEVLNLSGCLNLTEGGLTEILRISGIKLRVFDVSCTNITGKGFSIGREGISPYAGGTEPGRVWPADWFRYPGDTEYLRYQIEDCKCIPVQEYFYCNKKHSHYSISFCSIR